MEMKERMEILQTEKYIYKIYSDMLLSMIPVIKKYDGKVLNKRLVEEIRETCLGWEDGKHTKDSIGNISFEVDKEYFNFKLNIYVSNIIISKYIEENKFCCGIYDLRNKDLYSIYLPFECLTETETKKHRINADKIVQYFKEQSDEFLSEYNEPISEEYIQQMMKEMIEIRNALEEYEKKYDYSLRELFGCDYSIRKNGYRY